jgi:hypothetical protein
VVPEERTREQRRVKRGEEQDREKKKKRVTCEPINYNGKIDFCTTKTDVLKLDHCSQPNMNISFIFF